MDEKTYNIELIKTDPCKGWYFLADIKDKVFMESQLYVSADRAMWEFYWGRIKWTTKTMSDDFKKRML